MANTSLQNSKAQKNDEFYTFMNDIENELSQYDFSHFKDKIVYCNCDDPTWSNFFKFFIKWGKKLGIKEAWFTNFANGKRQFRKATLFENDDLLESIESDKKGTAHYWVYNPMTNKTTKKELKGNGDFRSEESIELLKQADIVVTNPPFSLFREYVAQLVMYGKKFAIIGDINARTNRDFFPLIKNDRVWIGYSQPKKFMTDENKESAFGNKCWYTNLDILKRHTSLVLHNHDLANYRKYDNYNALEVSQVKMIPDNYFGIMGVPITFLEKYCPKQFEIVWQASGNTRASAPKQILEVLGYIQHSEDRGGCGVLNGQRLYSRILIKRKGETK